MPKYLTFLLLLFLLARCNDVPIIDGFQKDMWANDLKECRNYLESKGAKLLIDQKNNILGISQNELMQLLGKPDRQQLAKRNQKFFYYQLNCQNSQELSIRFNAVGHAKEMMLITK